MHRQSIANTENLRRRGLGPVVYEAVGGKRRYKTVTRRKG